MDCYEDERHFSYLFDVAAFLFFVLFFLLSSAFFIPLSLVSLPRTFLKGELL